MANLQVGVAGNGTVTVGAGASVHSPANNALTLGTNNSERLRIDSSGNFGLNTSSPEDLLHIKTGKIRIENAIVSNNDSTISYDNDTFLVAVDPNNVRGSSKFQLKVDTVVGLTVDDTRRLLVGTTASIQTYGVQNRLQVAGDDYASSGIGIRRDSNDGGGGAIIFGKSRGSQGGVTVVQSGDSLGEFVFCGADGTDVTSYAGTINCSVDGTPGSNDMPGRLTFSTASDGAAGVTERVRIDKNGQLVLSNGSMSTAYGNSICGGTNLELDTTGIIKFRTDTNQKMSVTDNGLCFGTDSASANALNDYEEGSWTPVPARYTGGNANLSMSTQVGKYTKIGNLVRIEFYVVISSVTSQGSSLTQLRGLPFLPNASYSNTGVCFYNDGFQHDDDTDYTIITTVHSDNGGVVYFKANGCDAGNGLSTKNFQAGTITGSCTYRTDS